MKNLTKRSFFSTSTKTVPINYFHFPYISRPYPIQHYFPYLCPLYSNLYHIKSLLTLIFTTQLIHLLLLIILPLSPFHFLFIILYSLFSITTSSFTALFHILHYSTHLSLFTILNYYLIITFIITHLSFTSFSIINHHNHTQYYYSYIYSLSICPWVATKFII